MTNNRTCILIRMNFVGAQTVLKGAQEFFSYKNYLTFQNPAALPQNSPKTHLKQMGINRE